VTRPGRRKAATAIRCGRLVLPTVPAPSTRALR
jgi:hypothetical protein